jgi:hypothetical protein
MELKETKFYQHVIDFCKERNYEVTNTYDIMYDQDVPFDSIDRFIALYMLEKYPNIVSIDISNMRDERVAKEILDSTDDEFKEWYKLASDWAYDNYEREFISPSAALYHIIKEAKQGKAHVLADSYSDGGWFGAS